LREDMRIELRLLQQDLGVTTILVTHDQEEALSMSDRVVVMEQGDIAQIARPLDLYERPVNGFVSGFVGKTNFLSAKVKSPDTVLVGDEIVKLDNHGLPVGADVTLSIRPEKFRMSDDGSGHQVRVEAAIFLGASWLYRVSGSLGELFVTQPNTGQAGYANGDTAWLDWSRNAMSIFVEVA
jgi:putative spermidine/putrescine transport system ATP-binding protein